MKQGSPEWIAHRRNFIGASDAPVVMGVSPWRTRYQLWQEKLRLNEGQKENRAMIYGKEMEEVARQAYEEYTGNIVSREEKDTLVYHSEKKFMMASLDGFVLKKSIPLEIKNVGEKDHFTAKKGKIPNKYYPQVQHQIACLNVDLLHYFSYRYGDFALVEVERDPTYIDKLYLEEIRFWDLVLNLEAPELTDRDYVLFEDQEWDSLATKWRKVTEDLSVLENKEREYRAALIAKAAGQSSKGSGVCLTKIVRKGSINYNKIPELIGVDLERYRKQSGESWRLTHNVN